MGSEYQQAVSAFSQESVPGYLCEQICQTLLQERIRRERVRLIISSLFGAGSLWGLAFALPALFHAAGVTGFTSYAPLLISDSDLVASHFNTFMTTLLEAIPGPEVTATLFLLAVFLVSFKNFIRSLAATPFRQLSA